ncbi:MAG TPA: SDR family oxidoreductase [Acidimicrobiales bacterium]|jgi:NAD(P)-dependent dehydrogenase (short-subunit alcohol dehydrogenase family)
MRGLKDKVAVVAGGAGGIGTATSVRLAEEGCSVVVGDLNGEAAWVVAEQITATGGTAVSVRVDISDEESVADMVALAVTTYGGVDILHANAADLSPGTLGRDTNALDIDLDAFDRTLAVNLRGHLLCTRAALPEILKRGGGAIVYTSSGAAFMGEPERPSYAVSKSGINALVRHVASKWGRKHVRANAVAPGLVLTEGPRSVLSEDFMKLALRGTRSWRLGEPEDIAAMVAFLVSSDGEWINGQVLSVDGGASLR